MSGQIVSGGATFVVSSGVTDSGDVVADPGSLLIVNSGGTTIGALISNGATERVMAGGTESGSVIAGGTLELMSGGSTGAGPLVFFGSRGTLRVDDTAMPSSIIFGFVAGDEIDLAGVSLASGGMAGLATGNVLVVSAGGSAYALQLNPTQDFSHTSFRLLSDGHGGTEVAAESGLSINLSYDASVASAPAGFLSALAQATGALEAFIAAPATLNLKLGYGEIFGSAMSPGALGESGFFLDSYSYSDVKAALSASRLSADQLRAYNTLLASTAESGTLWLTTAQEKALGLPPGNGIGPDGAVGFSSSSQFSFASGTVPPAGKFYFIGVAEHEITEVMGRVSLLTDNLAGSASYSLMDLFRYASPGVLQTTSGGPSYFSIDGGTTDLRDWNNFVTGNHDDLGDWAASGGADAFNDRSGSGVVNSLTAVDELNMNVVGWQLSASRIVSIGQTFTVASGVTASNVEVQSGGILIVASGGTAYGTVVLSGGAEIVSSGGHGSVTVLSGGTEIVRASGMAASDFLLAGNEVVSGTATSVTVRSGALQGVASGGVANITFVSDGGVVTVFSGGFAGGAVVLSGGGVDILVGGSASGSIVSSGGSAVSIIGSGQSANVTSGQTVSDTVVLSGGGLVVLNGGATDGTILSGGIEVVSAGGLESATAIAGGTLELQPGAIVSGALFFSGTGGTLRIDGTTMPLNRISGLVAGDAIDLADVGFASGGSVVLSTTSSGSNLHITAAGVGYDLHLDPSEDYSSVSFRLLSDSRGGTLVEVRSAAAKPPETGLVDMSDIGFYQSGTPPVFDVAELAPYADSFGEIVLNLRWSDLEPAPGTLDTSFITSAIAQVEAFNSAHSTDLGIKLRVYGGYVAPDWAKNIDGTPFTVSGNHADGGEAHTVGRYWTADYIDAWQSFQAQLAAIYDDNPIIRGISQTAGAIASDEPFVPLSDGQPAILEAAGYTDSAEMLTLRAAISDYSAWSTTPLDFTFNPLFLQDSGRSVLDQNFPLAVLQQAQNSTRLVQPGNHALQAPISGSNVFVYAQMTADAALDPTTAPGSFQTQSPLGLQGYADWPATVSAGVAANGSDIELWDGPGTSGFTGLPVSAVEALAEIVSAGIAPPSYAPADGSALGFIAPAYVTGVGDTAAFTGTDAVLIASSVAQSFYTARVTLTSLDGGTLSVTNLGGIVQGSSSGTTITLAGPLALVNTVLASLVDTVSSGHDLVRAVATDIDGNQVVRTIGVVTSSGTVGLGPSSGGDTGFAGQLGNTLLIGGVSASLDIPGNLQIGPGGDYLSMLAALAPSAYSTASLTVGGTIEIASAGTAHFTGALAGGAVVVDSGGVLAGDGTLAAASGTIVNNGVIEATADMTLGLQQLVVSNAVSGSGTFLIDAGATLTLSGAVGSGQTIVFAPNSLEQFANAPYAPSTLVLSAPHGTQPTISGFTFADRLTLLGVAASSASYSSGTLTIDLKSGGTLAFAMPGISGGLTPVVSTTGSGADAETTISFVAATLGDTRPSVAAPATLRGGAGVAVFVPDIVIEMPLTANEPAGANVSITFLAAAGALSAGNNHDSTTLISSGGTLELIGTLDSVERSLRTLTYTALGTGTDTLSITVADNAGSSTRTTSVINVSSSLEFDWVSGPGGSFADSSSWSTTSGTPNAPPGGIDIAAFGSGTYTVSGDGAVGRIVVSGEATLTGQVTAQGIGSAGSALVVDSGGMLILAGGAVLTAQDRAVVGRDGEGQLVVMGGALDFTGASGTAALVVGEQSTGTGTVVDLETIAASGTVTVGQAGTGTLELLGIAATVSDGDAIIALSSGAVGSAIVNGGLWTTSGHLTVGAAGSGTLLVDGRQGGIAGQVTAYDATFGAQSGGVGSVTLDGGELLVANASASSSTLIVGGSGSGALFIENGGEAAIGVAMPDSETASNTGRLVVGTAAGGNGLASIGTDGALLVYGDGIVAGGSGSAVVSVGGSGTEGALFALLGNLDVGSTGRIALAGDDSTIRATTFHVFTSAVVSGTGTLSGDGGGNATVTLASIDNDGSIMAVGGDLLIYGDVTGSGILAATTSATIILQSRVGVSQILDFGADATAVLNAAGAFSGTIMDFAAGDVLDLAGLDATGVAWSGGVLALDTTSGVLQLALVGSYASNAFMVQSDGHGGTDIVLAPIGSAYVGQGETLVVSSGQSVSGIVVLNGGHLEVLSGGSAGGTSVRDGGTLTLSSGAAVTGTTLDPGSLEQIAAGYVLSGSTVSAGMTVDVLSGGLASNVTVLPGGKLDVLVGGAASGTIVSSGGMLLSGLGGGQTLIVSSGQTSSGIVVISGGIETVLSGGTAISTMVSNGGFEDVLGEASASTIFSGGTQQVPSGGTASGTVVSFGGFERVSSGGTASGAIVSYGGQLNVLSGGAVLATVVSDGGLATISGLASGIEVSANGSFTVLSGGVASATLVDANGLELVAGGAAIATSVASAGLLIVDSGGLASGTVVSSGGTLALVGTGSQTATTFLAGATFAIASGYVASGLVVTSDIPLQIANGGVASAAIVESGGIVTVVSGGTASATQVQGGGIVRVEFGTTVSDVLMGSGSLLAEETVSVGGAATGTIVSSSSLFQVLSGGVASNAIVQGTGSSGGLVASYGAILVSADVTSGGVAVLSGLSLNAVVESGGVMSVVFDAINSGVRSDGVNSSGLIENGGEVRVVGGLDLDVIVSGGGTETVLSGTAAGTIVRNDGVQVVASAGRGSNTVVSSGGVVSVVGGQTVEAIISSGGEARVSGGEDLSATVSSGGSETLVLAGSARDTRILDGGSQLVSSGGTADGTIISAFGVQQVLSSGIASGTIIYDHGVESAGAGANTLLTVISFGGLEIVDSGAVASGTVVLSGGTLELLSGGTAVAMALLAGATFEVASGYSISGYSVLRSTTLEVGAGGSASAVVVSSGAVEAVSSGLASATQVVGGGTVLVLAGGTTVSDVLVGSGPTLVARETVSSGGIASGTILSNTGLLTVSAGGLAVGAIVTNNPLGSSGGIVVLAGGSASSATLNNGGVAVVSGGKAIGTTIGSGAVLSITAGSDSAATIANGGLVLATGGADNDATVLNGGQLIVSSGGAANRTTLSSGGQTILSSGATASGIQVKGGGTLNVVGGSDLAATIEASGQLAILGGTDTGTTVLNSGVALVLAGGAASASLLSNGGTEVVSSGGSTFATVILGGGRESVLAGGSASDAVLSGGRLDVSAGSAVRTVVSSGGQAVVSSGGLARSTVVASSGAEIVSSAGVARDTTVLSNGVLTVLKGGTAFDTTISGGQEIVSSGGVNRSAVVSSGGAEVVVNGGTASGTTISSGGTEVVSSGGSANGALVAGGTQLVRTGAVANGTVVSSGREDVAGTANGTVVSGGSAVVSSGGTANGLVIDSDGSATVLSGGQVSGVTLSGGTLEIQSGGGVMSSTITFAGDGELVLDDSKFRGKIAGFSGSASDSIDLANVGFGPSTTSSYIDNGSSGTLIVSDGTHTAKLTLIGHYMLSQFTLSSDHNGGTLIVDPPVSGAGPLAPPH